MLSLDYFVHLSLIDPCPYAVEPDCSDRPREYHCGIRAVGTTVVCVWGVVPFSLGFLWEDGGI